MWCGTNPCNGKWRRITVAQLMTFTEDGDNVLTVLSSGAPLELSCLSMLYLIALRHNDYVLVRSNLDFSMGICTSLPVQRVSMQGARFDGIPVGSGGGERL
jgi:hypothetical protein